VAEQPIPEVRTSRGSHASYPLLTIKDDYRGEPMALWNAGYPHDLIPAAEPWRPKAVRHG